MDALERDALKVHSLLRSLKNSFAPINRIPSEVLSLITDYWDEDDMDRDLIVLTHVCRSWRTTFTSRSLPWSHLDCRDVNKTRTYIERSKTAPLEICLDGSCGKRYNRSAFLLAAPHINRLRYLKILTDDFPDIMSYFFHRAPLLKELDISLNGSPGTILNDAFLDGDLSSLQILNLAGVITRLSWNLPNLTTLQLSRIPGDRISMTQLLNLFENSPLLHTIYLEDSLPNSSHALPDRIVSLPRLDKLSVIAQPPHSTLLNHLSMPTTALLVLEFQFRGDTSPFPACLPKPSADFLSRITTVNLLFGMVEKFIRLKGSGGEAYAFGHRVPNGNIPPYTVDCRILYSLQPILSTTERLTISKLKLPTPIRICGPQLFRILNSMKDLRVLTLIKCHNPLFILALNPRSTPSNLVTCPKLEELVLYIEEWNEFYITDMLRMVEARASRDAKFSSITIVGLGKLVPAKEVFKLREHVTRVDYRVGGVPPDWDSLPGEASYGGYENE